MRIFKNIKSNRAATMTDVIIAMLILIVFTGVLTNSFYRIYKHNLEIRMNAIAVDYAVKILENIDKISYEEVNNDLNNTIKEDHNMNDNYTANLVIENYNKDDETKKDIIKIVTLTINYNVLEEEHTYRVKKLKIKEM